MDTLFKWSEADKGFFGFFSKEETKAAKEAEDQVRKNIAAIEEMRIEAEETEYQMKILFEHVKYNGKSVESAITEINEKLKKTAKYDLVDPTKLNASWVILKQYKELLETMSNKTFKNFAKASKEAFTNMIESINNQMELLGTPGESFLPGLNTMLKQFPVLSEQWVTIKRLVMSIENEIVEKQIANAKIVREFKEKQEEELSEKIQKEIKKREQQWENMFALNKLGFMPSSDLLAKATEEYERLLDLYKTNPTDYLNWPKELIKSYEQVHTLLVEKVQPVMDTLNAQFENGVITNAQYISALEKIKVQFEAYPSIVKLAEDAIVAFNLSAQASLPTVAGQIQAAWNDMHMAIAKAPSAIGDAFVSAIRGAENLGDAMRNLLQDIGAVIVKALLMKYILGPIMGFADGGVLSAAGRVSDWHDAGNAIVAKAKGGVFNASGITPFANGGIVNKPTLFPFANGIGLMGEAGPEAIMPLKRTSSGDLGVQAEGVGGMTNITMNINAVDSKSFVEMMRTNRASVESIIVENIMRNGAVRGAIKGMA
jgi:lambda family phage tail tape measure protein